MPRRVALVCFLLAVAGAAGGQKVDTVVHSVTAPRNPRVATLREELSIGVVEGKPEFMFGEIIDFAVSRDGAILIVDRKGLIIRHYDATGRFLGMIGRRGEGPGEHRAPPGVAFAPDGSILVWDTGTWRVNVFSPTGQYRRLWEIPRSTTQSASSARGLVVDTAGNVAVRMAKVDFATSTITRYWVRLRPNGTVLDSLFEPTVEGKTVSLRAERPGGATSSSDLPFSPRPQIAFSPLGHFVTGFPDRLAVELHRPGQPITSIRRPGARPLSVTAFERDSARDRVTDVMRRADPTWRWGNDEIPRTKPFYDRIFIGADGRIWLPLIKETLPRMGAISGTSGSGGPGRVAPPQRRPDGPPLSEAKVEALYDVYEPTGVYLGQVKIPPRHVVGVTRGDYLWAVAFDDDDVPMVKRYRIVW